MTLGEDKTRKELETPPCLLPYPSSAATLIRYLAGDDAVLEDAIVRFETDPALAIGILCTPEFKALDAPDLRKGLTGIGLLGITRFVLAEWAGRGLFARVPHPLVARSFWTHSLAVSAMARELSGLLGADPGRTATLGLLVDTGRLALLQSRPDVVTAVDADVARGGSVSDVERTWWGATGEDLALRLVRGLKLQGDLVSGLEDAFQSAPRTPEGRTVRWALLLATWFGCPVYRHGLETPSAMILPGFPDLDGARMRALTRVIQEALGTAGIDPSGHQELTLDVGASVDVLQEANRRLAGMHRDYERARHDLEDRIEGMRTLMAAFANLNMGLEPNALRYSILECLMEHCRVDAAFMVHSESSSGIMSGVAFSLDQRLGADVVPLTLDLSQFDQATRRELTRGQVVYVVDGETTGIMNGLLGNHDGWTLAPLLIRGTCCGFIGVGEREGNQRRERDEFLNVLAGAASLGLENARLYAELLHEATVDPLTSVATRRVVLQVLEELARAEGCDREAFGILLVDLDSFKAVNDTLGHQAGDRYLRETVAAIRTSLRRKDRLGRYGGDEFLVVLPGISPEDLSNVAHKIVAAVGEVGKAGRWAEVPARLGATVGIAWWDGEPTDAATLIAEADASLYRGKEGGGQRVGSFLTHTKPISN